MGNLFSESGLLLAAAAHGAEDGHHGGHHATLSFIGLLLYVALTLLILLALMGKAKKGFNKRVFSNPIAHLFEQLYLFIENMCVGIIGPHGKKYIPMIMTFWMVIFVSNLVALFMPTSPTANLSFNLGLALVSIGYVQYEGMKANGVFGHFRHFAGPSAPLEGASGAKRFVALGLWSILAILIFSIEIISEMMKNVSLSLRLFGNIDGGHQAVVAMNDLFRGAGVWGIPIGDYIPLGAFLLPVKLLTCLVQALIFSLLSCVYLGLVTHHEDHGDGHEADHHSPTKREGEVALAH